MTEKVNSCYVYTLYEKVKNGSNLAVDEFADYYFKKYPINYYEEVVLDEFNLEQMFLCLYDDEWV